MVPKSSGGVSKLQITAFSIVIAVAAGLLIWWLSHKPQPPEDCAFTGWKRTVGVELEGQVENLQSVRGTLGISDSMIRDYDTLMKDYALKYDSVCQDFRGGRMTQGEYTCLRQNMLHVLDDIRAFNQAVEAAKAMSDPNAQKTIVLKAFGALQQASKSGYHLGCTSALNVNPKAISFTGDTLAGYVEITNSGNNDFTFSVDGLPGAFRPHPPVGKLSVSGTAALVIERSFGPVPPTQPIKFLVRTNLNDTQEVAITVDQQNANVFQRLGKKLRTHIKKSVAVREALNVVDAATSSRVPKSEKYVLASTLLLYTGQSEPAKAALTTATNEDPSLNRQPTTLFLNGVIANRQQQPEAALDYFAKAKKSVGPTDDATQSMFDLASGIINFNLGRRDVADTLLKRHTLDWEVWENPRLVDFGAKEFCGKGECQAYVDHTYKDLLSPKKVGG